MKKEKICVAGVGAVGTILASLLGRKYPERLSLVARGGRAASMKEEGIRLHSQFYGEVIGHAARIEADPALLGVQDIIFLCVKNYSLGQMMESLRPAVGPETVLVPVMNGIEAGDILRAAFPGNPVCDGVIYTTTGSNPDYSATQTGPYTYLFIGSKSPDAEAQAAADGVYELLKEAGLDARRAEDIELEIWQKYILNCAYNTITARHLACTKDLRARADLQEDLKGLLTEAYHVAEREGVKIPADIAEQKFTFIMTGQSPDATSSMKRDVEAKRPIENDAFAGAILRKSHQYGLAAPVTERYYRELEEITAAY